MSTEPKRTLDEVLTAIKGSTGIKATIASRLGVSRLTVDAYLKRWQTAQEAYTAKTELNIDLAETLIHTNIRNGVQMQQKNPGLIVNSDDAWKYLKTKGKGRGYVEKSEIDHNIDITKLSDDQLRDIIAG